VGKLFISYRRTDSADQAGRVFDRLVGAFSKDSVFKDVDSVPAGADFRKVLEEAVKRAETVILIIGPSWLNTTDERGHRRLDDQNDFVRLELEFALKLGKLIIPVLVRGGAMPRPDDLPEALKDVAFRHAVSVRPDPDFHRDMDRLIQAIKARKAERYKTSEPTRAKIPKWLPYALAGCGVLLSTIVVWGLLIGFKSPDAARHVPPVDTTNLPFPPAPSKVMPGEFVLNPALQAPTPNTETARLESPMPSPQGPAMAPAMPAGDAVPPAPATPLPVPPAAPAPGDQ
jgi:hypothetical protein